MPLSWLDVYGNFLYTRPETETNYQQFNTGNFAISNAALFVTTQQLALASQARMPHTAGSTGAEIRPLRRTRLMVTWLTDRLDNTGTAAFQSFLRNEYNQSDADLIVDASRQWTLRGGYRYVWGDTQNFLTPAAGLLGAESAHLRRHIGKGGFTYRPASRLSLSVDAEVATSGASYFRTSLNDYQRVRLRGRYQATATLSFALDMALLNNQNPTPGADFSFRSRAFSTSLLWGPAAAKRLQVMGS